MMAQDQISGQDWLISRFYGYPETSKRTHSWSLSRKLNPNLRTPWFCFSDFNEIISQDEKKNEPIPYPYGKWITSKKF